MQRIFVTILCEGQADATGGGTYGHLDPSDGVATCCDIKKDNWVRHDEKR